MKETASVLRDVQSGREGRRTVTSPRDGGCSEEMLGLCGCRRGLPTQAGARGEASWRKGPLICIGGASKSQPGGEREMGIPGRGNGKAKA